MNYVLPQGNYTMQIKNVPLEFNENSIKTYTDKKHAWKHFSRGYVFFTSNHIKQILLHFGEIIYIKGSVIASYDRKTLHQCYVIVDKDGSVISGKCDCKCGSGGVCSHVISLLWCVLDSKNSGKNFVQLKTDVACTEKPQTWGCGPKNFVPGSALFVDLEFIKNVPLKQKRNHLLIKKRRIKRQSMEVNVTSQMLHDMHSRLMSANVNATLCKCIISSNFEPKIRVVQRNEPEIELDLPINLPMTPLWESDLEQLQRSIVCPFLVKDLSLEECWDIERRTRQQSDCQEWQNERGKVYVTASKFHKIVNRKKSVTDVFVRSMFGNNENFTENNEEGVKTKKAKSSFAGNSYTRLGLLNEDIASRKYASVKSQNGENENSGVIIYKCGLVINPGLPFLGASPDRVIYDKSTDEYGLLEIKTLSKAKTLDLTLEESIDSGCAKNLFLENGEVKLKANTDFYTQMQGQMAITGIKFCDLIVDCGKEFYVERFFFDEKHWREVMLPKLFYFCHTYYPHK